MKRTLRYLLQKYYCEILWFFKKLQVKRASRKLTEQPKRKQQEIALEQTSLRSVLKEYPFWMLGHARLGVSELELLRISSEPLEGRARAAVRLSAEAIRILAKDFGVDINHGRALLTAEVLEATLDFIDRDFVLAKERYAKLLEPQNAAQIHRHTHWLVLENAAACALVLDGKEAADSYLRHIPPLRREEFLQ